MIVRIPGAIRFCAPLKDLQYGGFGLSWIKNLKYHRKLLTVGKFRGKRQGVIRGIPDKILLRICKSFHLGKIFRFIFCGCQILLRADETNITIVLHSAEYGCSDEI